MKLIFSVLPLCLAVLASCSSAARSGRHPHTLEGRSRAEILAEFGKPLRSSNHAKPDAGKVSSDVFRVDNTWQSDAPEPESIFERTNRYSANATETLFLPVTLAAKSREAVIGRELTVQYLPDERQTVKAASVRIP